MRFFSFLIFSLLIIGCSNSESSANNPTKDTSSKTQADQQKQAQKTGIWELDSLNKIINSNLADAGTYAQRSLVYLNRNNNQNAYLDLLKARDLDSLNSKYLFAEGEYRITLNMSRKARNAWLKCTKVDLKSIDCRLRLAKLYLSVGELDKAIKACNEVIDINPYQAEAYLYKGLVVRNKYKDTAAAMRFIQQATELKPDYTEALDLMGVLLSSQKDTLAPYYYNRVLETEPNRADIYYKLGVHYMTMEDVNKAIESYTKATKINPQHSDSYYNLGYIFIQLQEYSDARDYFTAAIKSQQTNLKAHYGRGYAHEMLGDVINAKKDYLTVLESLPMHTAAQEGLNRINQ